MNIRDSKYFGRLARETGYILPLKVQRSAAGYYLGTSDEEGPVSRESVEYWDTKEEAQNALDAENWTQRDHP